MATQKKQTLSLKHFGVKSPPDDPLLLMDIGRGIAIGQNGQLPTEEERSIAARLLIVWHDRQNERWELSPKFAAKIEREISAKIDMEQTQGNDRICSGDDSFDFERSTN